MNNRALPSWILLITLLSISLQGYTQKIEHVESEVSGSTIHIYYDLLDIAPEQLVNVVVYLSTDGGITYGDELKSVVGDVGVVLGSGQHKQIIWDVFAEVEELVSDSVKFRIEADLLVQNTKAFNPGYMAGVNASLGSKVEMNAYGFKVNGGIILKQFTLGVRGDYFKTYGDKHPLADTDDTGIYAIFSGGLFGEYQLIRNPKFSLYPLLGIGQTKIEYMGGPPEGKYVGYSMTFDAGVGIGVRLTKFLFLGAELEYMMAQVIQIDNLETSLPFDHVTLDGLSAGITLRFMKPPPKQ